MNDLNTEKSISYLAFESEMARAERTIKRLWISGLMLLALLTVTNGYWIIRLLR